MRGPMKCSTRSSTRSSSKGPAKTSSISPTSSPRARPGSPRTTRTPTSGDVKPLFDMIVSKVPGPVVDPDSPFRMLCTTLDFSEYVGRIAIGRIYSGRVRRGQKAVLIKAGDVNVAGSIDSVLVFDKLGRTEVEIAEAGDIVAIVGLSAVDIGDTIADPEQPVALPRIEVDEPTSRMLFTVNDSPLTGEGQYLTSRHLKERLERELKSNVALRVEPSEDRDAFIVSGRGLLHLSGPDRDDAARGIRAGRRQARGHLPRDQRRAVRAVRVPGRRRAAQPHRPGDRARPAPGAARWPRWT